MCLYADFPLKYNLAEIEKKSYKITKEFGPIDNIATKCGAYLRGSCFQKLLLVYNVSCINKNGFLSRRRIPLAILL